MKKALNKEDTNYEDSIKVIEKSLKELKKEI